MRWRRQPTEVGGKADRDLSGGLGDGNPLGDNMFICGSGQRAIQGNKESAVSSVVHDCVARYKYTFYTVH